MCHGYNSRSRSSVKLVGQRKIPPVETFEDMRNDHLCAAVHDPDRLTMCENRDRKFRIIDHIQLVFLGKTRYSDLVPEQLIGSRDDRFGHVRIGCKASEEVRMVIHEEV